MADYITLLGAEEVSRAASSMRDAAETMSRAASNFDYSIQANQRFMDDWLARFEAAVERLAPTQKGGE